MRAKTNYHIVADNELKKLIVIDIIRAAGAELTGVSGYGSGCYIQIDATPEQAANINKRLEAIA